MDLADGIIILTKTVFLADGMRQIIHKQVFVSKCRTHRLCDKIIGKPICQCVYRQKHLFHGSILFFGKHCCLFHDKSSILFIDFSIKNVSAADF